jgi:hypothetical protein
MEFESQVCTNIEQSKRLLALGLKKETADMHHYQYVEGGRWNVEARPSIAGYNNRLIPAWSLHRLIEILPKRIKNIKEDWDKCAHDIAFVITEELEVNYEEPFEDFPCYNKYFIEGNLYDKIVDCIEWLIKKGYFNKDYLEE